MNAFHFPRSLRWWRLHRRVGVTELGRRVDVGRQAVHAWEAGHATPTLERLHRIADVLDVPVRALLEAPPTVDVEAGNGGA